MTTLSSIHADLAFVALRFPTLPHRVITGLHCTSWVWDYSPAYFAGKSAPILIILTCFGDGKYYVSKIDLTIAGQSYHWGPLQVEDSLPQELISFLNTSKGLI